MEDCKRTKKKLVVNCNCGGHKSFCELLEVGLNHSCVLYVAVERLFILAPSPFVFLYFITFLPSLVDRRSDCGGRPERMKTLTQEARHYVILARRTLA